MKDFFIQNIIWELILVGIILLLGLFDVFFIVQKLLHNNRSTRGNGHGKHFADRFLDIYYTKHKLRSGNFFYKSELTKQSMYVVGVIDKNLKEMNLIEIEGDYVFVERNKSWRKKMRSLVIVKILEICLVCCVGDSKHFYKNKK